MVAVPLAVTDRYVAPETSRTYYASEGGVANINAVTRVELNAMVDLTAQTQDASGWDVSAENVDVPDGGNIFTGQIPGRVKPGDASVVCYASRDTDDIRTVIERGDKGFILHLHGGDIEGTRMDVYPVRVRTVSKPVDYSGSNAAMITVQFSITSLPGENVLVPAA